MKGGTAGPAAAGAANNTAAAPRRRRGKLFRKYILLFVVLVGGALLASGALEVWFSYQENKAALARIQHEKALAAAARIEQFIDEMTRQIGWTTRAQWSRTVLEQRRFEYLQLLRQAPAITEVSHLDAQGREELRVSRLAMDVIGGNTDLSGEPKFIEAKARKTWFSPVYFRKESEPYITIAIAGTGRDSGVTVAEVNLKFIWDVISRIKVGKAGHAYVVDTRGLLIAHPDIGLVLRKTDLSGLPQVATSIADPAAADGSQAIVGADSAGHQVLTAHAAIAPLDWTVFVDLPLSEAFAPLYASLQRTAGLILLGLALAVGAGILLARRMIVPIQAMQAGAARIGAGDLDHRIEIRTGDELETLADQFNRMTAQLEESYAGLERKVEERTAELTELLAQQTATADVLRVIAGSPGDLSPVFAAMLENATRMCEARYGILWLYEDGSYRAAARMGTPPAYDAWLDQGPTRAGPGTALGRVQRGERLVHIADIRDEDTYRSGDPHRRATADLGGIRTLLVVGIRKESALVGAFGIYRQEVRPFTEKQVALVSTFADQAVIAIENARLLEALQARTDELGRSVAELTTTSEVLRVIASSPGKLEPVLQSVAENAARLCEAADVAIHRVEGDKLQFAAHYGPLMQRLVENKVTIPLTRGGVSGRAVIDRRTIHVPDFLASTDYPESPLHDPRQFPTGSVRTVLVVPLLRESVAIGSIVVLRREMRPFTAKQIELITSFADQAVIAIENARLLEALQARTDELGRSVEELTATSDVLRIIARSPGDLQPVLDTLVETAKRVCAADRAMLFRADGATYRLSASSTGWRSQEFMEFFDRNPIVPGRATGAGRTIVERRPVHILDVWSDPDYGLVDFAKNEDLRTLLGVPLLREGVPIGVITVNRNHVKAFTPREIELLTTFADQAVIAIENARLLEALQTRTDELGRSVEELTATSDVLRIIARSPGDLQPVLDTLVETAKRVCGADRAFLFRSDGGAYRLSAHSTGWGRSQFLEFVSRTPIKPGPGTGVGRALLERRPVHILDALSEPGYEWIDFSNIDGFRTVLGVPLLRDGVPIGVITVNRTRVEAFTAREIELLTTFADQAVIAIENARLLEELQARTDELAQSVDELKALGEVGRAVSSTLDLKTVLETIVTRAAELGDADACSIFRYRPKARQFKLWHAAGLDPNYAMTVRALDVSADETVMGRAVQSPEPMQVADLSTLPNMPLRDASLAAGYRSVLIVPLVRVGRVFGALVLHRRQMGEFPPGTVNLLRTFASQSILAIQNARLFREIEEKGQQLAIASQHKSQFLANMSHELRTPLNAILGYTELLLDGLYGKLGDKAQGVLERVQSNGRHLLGLINDVLDLAKIEAGQLTLTVADYSIGAMVQSVVAATESLAKAKGLELKAEVAPAMPLGHGDERRLTQVLLNLVGNAIKFTEKGSVTVSAHARDGQFRIAIRDTGPGIAESDQARIFEEFQQVDNSSTRKKGGTGLGLAISRRIVEMHGGTIAVESQLGAGATFRIDLPIQLGDTREVA